MSEKKLTFFEWWAGFEFEGCTPEQAGELIRGWIAQPFHKGDCTDDRHACGLCSVERLLADYHNYFFGICELCDEKMPEDYEYDMCLKCLDVLRAAKDAPIARVLTDG